MGLSEAESTQFASAEMLIDVAIASGDVVDSESSLYYWKDDLLVLVSSTLKTYVSLTASAKTGTTCRRLGSNDLKRIVR